MISPPCQFEVACVALSRENSAKGRIWWSWMSPKMLGADRSISQLMHPSWVLIALQLGAGMVSLCRHGSLPLVLTCCLCTQIIGSVACMFLVDSAGRRPLLIWGSALCGLSLLALGVADHLHSAHLMVAAMCAFIMAFSASYAGIFWVLLSELFSMTAKAPAAAAATAALFIAGAHCCCCGRHAPRLRSSAVPTCTQKPPAGRRACQAMNSCELPDLETAK